MEDLSSFQLGHLLEDALAFARDLVLELLVVVEDVGIEHLGEGRGTSAPLRVEHALEDVDALATRMGIYELQNLNIPPVGSGILEGIRNLTRLVARFSISTANNVHMTHG